ncbi:g9751 [Coccomyxa viridis]|uniref:G9751 protein n=1 Tax=Coccomyxa viridis TaxID=1274662 RepID=A0ABP1G8A7_9CHLO
MNAENVTRPFTYSVRAGKKTLRDFQECRKFLDPSAVDERGSIGSSTAYRKRHKKDGKENHVMGQPSLLLPTTCTQHEGALDIGSSLGPSREIQTPLVAHKMSVLQSASLEDNPCTGVSLVTPLDQQSKGQRLAMNTLGSSISTGLAFTPGLHATPITEEAPRPIGRSESPVVPKNLIGADSPGISDLPDIATHAEGQPSAEGAPCIGELTHKAEAKSRQLEPCDSDASAQHALYLHADDNVDLCNGHKAGDCNTAEASPQTAQAATLPLEAAGQMDTTPPAMQQLSLAPSPACQQSTTGAGVPIQPLPWREQPAAAAVLAIPCLDTTRVAKISPAAPAVHGSQKKKEAKIEALSTAPPAVHAEPLTQQLLQPSQRTAPKTIAIIDLTIAPYKDAVGGLWREKWGWSRPIPKTTEAKAAHQRTCRLEARFLEGCRNLMRLQCDSDRSWQELARQ